MSGIGCRPDSETGYTRKTMLKQFSVATLEYDFVGNTLLLRPDGRIVSFLHRFTRSDLLSGNCVFQPSYLVLVDDEARKQISRDFSAPMHINFPMVVQFRG